MPRASVVVAMLVLVACGGGGGSPSAPSTPRPTPVSGWPAGTTVELVSGDTGAPIAGQLKIAGVAVQANAPLAAAAPPGFTVDVTLPGFLVRQTSVRTGETRLTLWPDAPQLPAAYTRSLVYTGTTDDAAAPLRRLASRVHAVAVVAGAGADPDVLDYAVTLINHGATPAGITYLLGGSGDFTVPVRLESGNDSCTARTLAFASIWYGSAGEITRAEVVYCTQEAAQSVATTVHELGHTFGLRHSEDPRDLMCAYYNRFGSWAPTLREALTMRLMMLRRPGTVFPDNDREAKAAAVRFEVVE